MASDNPATLPPPPPSRERTTDGGINQKSLAEHIVAHLEQQLMIGSSRLGQRIIEETHCRA